MKRTFFALLFLLASSQAWAVNDCRIKQIVFSISAQDQYGNRAIKISYLSYEGTLLNVKFCPDQGGPTLGTDLLVAPIDNLGYDYYLSALTPGTYNVEVTAGQNFLQADGTLGFKTFSTSRAVVFR